jgi:hypothetical protein
MLFVTYFTGGEKIKKNCIKMISEYVHLLLLVTYFTGGEKIKKKIVLK